MSRERHYCSRHLNLRKGRQDIGQGSREGDAAVARDAHAGRKGVRMCELVRGVEMESGGVWYLGLKES